MQAIADGNAELGKFNNKEVLKIAFSYQDYTKFLGDRYSDILARYPTGGPLIFSAVRDDAFFAAGDKFKNNQLVTSQASLAMILGTRKDQPVAGYDFISSDLIKDLVTSVRF
jgi:hypothetical protein